MSANLSAGRTVPKGNILVFATVSADPLPMEVLRRNAGEMAVKWKLPGLVPSVDVLIHSPEPPAGPRS